MFGDLRNECSEGWSKYLWNIATVVVLLLHELYSLQIVVHLLLLMWLPWFEEKEQVCPLLARSLARSLARKRLRTLNVKLTRIFQN